MDTIVFRNRKKNWIAHTIFLEDREKSGPEPSKICKENIMTSYRIEGFVFVNLPLLWLYRSS